METLVLIVLLLFLVVTSFTIGKILYTSIKSNEGKVEIGEAVGSKSKRLLDHLVLFLFYLVMTIAVIAFLCFWVGACVGNFLNVDEYPFPGLHWKA